MRGLRKKNEGNPLYKHKVNDHPNEKAEFKMEVGKQFRDPLTRLANEGVRIRNRKSHELLNSKSEFHQPSVVRLQVENKQKIFRNKRKEGCNGV